jgi:putative ABC transport system permease protein
VLGGILGCAGCYLWLVVAGNTKDMFGASTFTTMAFEIKLTMTTILISLAAVSAVGLIGALVPALRASKTQVVQALREA